MSDTNPLRRPGVTQVVVALLVPIVPFLVVGWWLEPAVEQWFQGEHRIETSPPVQGIAIFLGLAVDILLPIPSSLLLTVAGQSLGFLLGTLVGWMGLNTSALAGYYGGRWYGQRFYDRFGAAKASPSPGPLLDGNQIGSKMLLFASRPVPILAEACVIWAGMKRVDGWSFWLPVLSGNLLVAAFFALLGAQSREQQWMAIALFISMWIPLVILAGLRWRRIALS